MKIRKLKKELEKADANNDSHKGKILIAKMTKGLTFTELWNVIRKVKPKCLGPQD